MTPHIRKFALTAHIAVSVGWLGAVAGWLALAVAGLTGQNTPTAHAAYLAMSLTAWFVIVPLAVASLLSGIVMSLGTNWGLFEHYWVLAKLLLTSLASIVLLLKMALISRMAVLAEKTLTALNHARIELVLHAGGGLLVLLAITAVSVFKPWGRTGFRRRNQRGPTGSNAQH